MEAQSAPRKRGRPKKTIEPLEISSAPETSRRAKSTTSKARSAASPQNAGSKSLKTTTSSSKQPGTETKPRSSATKSVKQAAIKATDATIQAAPSTLSKSKILQAVAEKEKARGLENDEPQAQKVSKSISSAAVATPASQAEITASPIAVGASPAPGGPLMPPASILKPSTGQKVFRPAADTLVEGDAGRPFKPAAPRPIPAASKPYKSIARRYTAIMVALPITIFTSYVLYDRLILGNEQKHLQRIIPGSKGEQAAGETAS